MHVGSTAPWRSPGKAPPTLDGCCCVSGMPAALPPVQDLVYYHKYRLPLVLVASCPPWKCCGAFVATSYRSQMTLRACRTARVHKRTSVYQRCVHQMRLHNFASVHRNDRCAESKQVKSMFLHKCAADLILIRVCDEHCAYPCMLVPVRRTQAARTDSSLLLRSPHLGRCHDGSYRTSNTSSIADYTTCTYSCKWQNENPPQRVTSGGRSRR